MPYHNILRPKPTWSPLTAVPCSLRSGGERQRAAWATQPGAGSSGPTVTAQQESVPGEARWSTHFIGIKVGILNRL